MDYLQHFRPLLSLAAHAASAIADGDSAIRDDKALWRTLDTMAVQALAKRTVATAGDFDAAWFAVAAWLDETLGWLRPEAERRVWRSRRGLGSADPGSEFFLRLDAALDAGNPQVTAVYAACLALGFRGRHHSPAEQSELDYYRLRCQTTLHAASPIPETGFLQQASPAAAPPPRSFSMALFWAAPLAATAGLFFLYRTLLTELFDRIMGM